MAEYKLDMRFMIKCINLSNRDNGFKCRICDIDGMDIDRTKFNKILRKHALSFINYDIDRDRDISFIHYDNDISGKYFEIVKFESFPEISEDFTIDLKSSNIRYDNLLSGGFKPSKLIDSNQLSQEYKGFLFLSDVDCGTVKLLNKDNDADNINGFNIIVETKQESMLPYLFVLIIALICKLVADPNWRFF